MAGARVFLRGLGKTLIALGVLILLFVAYQLWGTGIAEARAQHRLRHEFAASTPPTTAPPPTTSVASVPSTPSTTSTTESPLPPPPTGQAVAILRMPSIGVDVAVVEGVGVEDLKKGPGHYPKTPLPGQPGNTAIAGHRTTYGAPFYHLDSLKPGDPILIATHQGTFEYRMVSEQAVDPTDVAVIAPTADNRLTLTTCTPRFTARQRLVVVARLIGPATVPPPPPATPGPATPVTAPAAASVGSLSGQGTTTLPATAWGLACAALWLAAFLAGRRWRRWAVYAVATPVFLVALFFFFENFARFVPANL